MKTKKQIKIEYFKQMAEGDLPISKIINDAKGTKFAMRRQDALRIIKSVRLESYLNDFKNNKGRYKKQTYKQITRSMEKYYKRGNFLAAKEIHGNHFNIKTHEPIAEDTDDL